MNLAWVTVHARGDKPEFACDWFRVAQDPLGTPGEDVMPRKKGEPQHTAPAELERQLPGVDDPVWNALEIAYRMNTRGEIRQWVKADSLDYPSEAEWEAFLAPLPRWQADHLSALRRIGLPWEEVRVLPDYLKTIMGRKQKLLESMTELIEDSLMPFRGRPVITNDQTKSLREWEEADLEEAFEEYTKLMAKAARSGILWHPWVARWVANAKGLGQRDALRLARGLEKGVKRPIPPEDVRLWDTISRLQEPPAPGKRRRSLEAIRRLLIKQGTIPSMTRQAFSKLVARLNTVEGLISVSAGTGKTVYRFQTTEGKSSMKVRFQKAPTRKPPKKS